MLAVVALLASSGLAACGSSEPSDTATATSSTIGAVTPEARALLTRLTTEGSDAAFDQRFGGELDAGAEAGPFVFVGRAGDQAVVYACDGTTGTWFTGTTASDGSGELRSTDGVATVALEPLDGGFRTTFQGGAFAERSTTATELGDGDGILVRLEATDTAGGPTAAVGGIIVTPAGVRGVFTSSITDGSSNTLILGESPTTTASTTATTRNPAITDGQSNTVIIGETPTTTTPALTDGQSNTVIIGEAPTTTTPATGGNPTTTTRLPADPTGTTIVSKTPNGLLTVRIAPRTTSTSTTVASTSACAARVAVLGDLARALSETVRRSQSKLEALRAQGGLPPALRDRAVVGLQRQIEHLTAQLDELRRQLGPCTTTSGAPKR